jgi:hypothetical protein
MHAPHRGSYYDSMLAECSMICLAGWCVFIVTKFCTRIYPRARLFRGSLVTATPGAGCGKVTQFETQLCKTNESDHRSEESRNTGEITREQ